MSAVEGDRVNMTVVRVATELGSTHAYAASLPMEELRGKIEMITGVAPDQQVLHCCAQDLPLHKPHND